jgi:DNA-binding transcriptional ArsR family regulator
MTPPELSVTPECRTIRATVGPVAWVVLEELALTATRGRSLETATTIRDLADAVGLSKDTVASGLRRLMKHGLVTRVAQRDRRSGCFGNSVYRLHLAGSGLTPNPPDGPTPDPEASDTVAAAMARRDYRPQNGRVAAGPSAEVLDTGSASRPGSAGQMSLLEDPPPNIGGTRP